MGRRAQKSGHQLAASPYWITSRVELHRITRAGIYKKNQIKGILKVSYCFITSWQRHSNDFRLQSVVDLRWYEYDFCLFYTQTYVVFLLF